MLIYPEIDPIAFHILNWPIYWYGIMYFFSFLICWWLLAWRNQTQNILSSVQLSDLLCYIALGVLFGGRIGYLLFYDWPKVFTEPWLILEPWKRGMSFHGGLVGVLFGVMWYAKKHNYSFLVLTDFIAPVVPIGLGLGRIGNFINGELWGRVSNLPWAMIFPHVDLLPRHPSQLYEFFLEGPFLLIIMLLYAREKRQMGRISGFFLVCYALLRGFVEFWREPDVQMGLFCHLFTAGQILSCPMLLIGGFLLFRSAQQSVAGHETIS